MNGIDHEEFAPYHFGSACIYDQRADESDLFPLMAVLPDTGRRQCHQKAIHLSYDPTNFQHLSLIARMFNRAFVNHSKDGDSSGLATVIEALPSITFALSDSQISLQFIAEPGSIETHDSCMNCDLRSFVDAAPCGIQIAWSETLIWRLDADGRISERWQTPVPVTV